MLRGRKQRRMLPWLRGRAHRVTAIERMLGRMLELGAAHPIRASFYRFGLYCASHQLRVIISSCLLICLLLYPALATHYSSQPLTHFSTKMLDSFMPPSTPATAFRTDVRHLWEGHDIFRVREDPAALTKCGTERTIRLERVIVPSTAPDPRGALNKHTLRSTLDLQRRIAAVLAENDFTDVASCVRDPRGHCLFLSPLAFWHDSPDALDADPQIIRTINFGPNATAAGLPLHATTTLAGRASDPHSGKTTYAADFLVLTYFFPEVMCHDAFGHNLWLRGLEHAVAGFASISHTAYRPQLLALERASPTPILAGSSFAIWGLYAFAIVYLAGPLWRIKNVHSRIGLACTAFVELLASTVMSVSVCVMWGWRVTMVPWTVLPAVIVIVGTENMWHLLSSLADTPITLPVKERVGIAMSQAGATNSIELLSYTVLLGLIASFTVGAIRQFCVFGMVVVIVHWCMIHTFWITILSIDAQRLELDEYLRQQPEAVYGAIQAVEEEKGAATRRFDALLKRGKKSGVLKFFLPVLRFMRRHYAINSTLFMFVGLMAALYWKYPFASKQSQVRFAITHGILSPSPPQQSQPVWHSDSDLPSSSPSFDTDSISPAQRFWDLVNPTNQALVHIRIETPTIVQPNSISPDTGLYPDPGPLWGFFYNVFRPGLWMIKIMVLPIGATMGLLWAFLMYLLKDADVLEAQRNRPPAVSGAPIKPGSGGSVGENVAFGMLPRAQEADVDFVAASRTGGVVVTVSTVGEIVYWNLDAEPGDLHYITLSSLLPSGERLGTVTSLDVCPQGVYCAVGTRQGKVFLWSMQGGQADPLGPFEGLSDVTSLRFVESESSQHQSGSSNGQPLLFAEHGASSARGVPDLVVAYKDGSVSRWHVADARQVPVLRPTFSSAPSRVESEAPGSSAAHIASFKPDSTLEVQAYQSSTRTWHAPCTLIPQPPADGLTDVVFCTIQLVDTPRTVAVTASSAGRIYVFDALDGTLLHASSMALGPVDKLRVAPLPHRRCQRCGEVPMDGFVIVAQTADDKIRLARATVPGGGKRCSCLHDYYLTAPSLTATDGSHTDSPKRSLDAPPSLPSTPGMRRKPSGTNIAVAKGARPPWIDVSDKTRRGAESASTSSAHPEEHSLSSAPPSPLTLSGDVQPGRPSFDLGGRRHVWHGMRVQALPEVACERGTWDLLGHVIVGIRRITQPTLSTHQNGNGRAGKGRAAAASKAEADDGYAQDLQRWEAWTLDTSDLTPVVRHTELKDLPSLPGRSPTSPTFRSTLGFPRLPFTRVTSGAIAGPGVFAAGFGNALGMLDFSRSSASSVILTAPGEEPFAFH